MEKLCFLSHENLAYYKKRRCTTLYTYLDFAESDYRFFRECTEANIIGTALAKIGYDICERYLKHIIFSFGPKSTFSEILKKEDVLKSDRLTILLQYIQKNMDISVSSSLNDILTIIEQPRIKEHPHPGTSLPTQEDIENVIHAVEQTRQFVFSVLRKHTTGAA